jgi:hypothetical protein
MHAYLALISPFSLHFNIYLAGNFDINRMSDPSQQSARLFHFLHIGRWSIWDLQLFETSPFHIVFHFFRSINRLTKYSLEFQNQVLRAGKVSFRAACRSGALPRSGFWFITGVDSVEKARIRGSASCQMRISKYSLRLHRDWEVFDTKWYWAAVWMSDSDVQCSLWWIHFRWLFCVAGQSDTAEIRSEISFRAFKSLSIVFSSLWSCFGLLPW